MTTRRAPILAFLVTLLACSAVRCQSAYVYSASSGNNPRYATETPAVSGSHKVSTSHSANTAQRSPLLDDLSEVPELVAEPQDAQPPSGPMPMEASAPVDNPFYEAPEATTSTNTIQPVMADEWAGATSEPMPTTSATGEFGEYWPAEVYEGHGPLRPLPPTENSFGRPRIIFRPAVVGVDNRGEAVLRPNVAIADGSVMMDGMSAESTGPFVDIERLPPPAQHEEDNEYPVHPEWSPYLAEPAPYVDVGPWQKAWYTLMANLNGPRKCPSGVGPEYVMHAPFWIDTTQPLNNCRVRGDGAIDWEFPDRAEYFWARTPPTVQPEFDGVGGETLVDYQDVRFYIERGTDRFSVGTELPIRAVDPEIRRNTAGFADMNLVTKAVLLDGKCWQLTQLFRTYFPTGSKRRGTGNGHFSLEPGVAWRYKWSDITYFHGDLKYWFPIAADPDQSGQVFDYGIGISHVWIDRDDWALIPTLELKAWTILDGQQTLPGTLVVGEEEVLIREEIDTIGILNLHPGLRWVCDKGCDCGTKEFGVTGGFSLTDEHWYRGILRLEFRWTR